MGNALANAGGLDGNLNWAAFGGGSIAVDETTIGGPGRGAFILSGNAGAAEGASIYSDNIVIVGGELVEAYGYTRGFGDLHVDFLDITGTTTLQSISLPRARSGAGSAARRGMLYSFDYAYGRLQAPANAARARLSAGANVSAGPYTLALTKPYLAGAPSVGRSTVWDPGAHTNPDLQLPAWPSQLPPFQADSLPEPIANMVGYGSDTNIQATRDLYSGLQQSFKGHMRLDYDQVDILQQFYDANRSGFFVVRPDTDQLCVARWMPDGAPKAMSNAGPWTMYEVGLRLAVA